MRKTIEATLLWVTGAALMVSIAVLAPQQEVGASEDLAAKTGEVCTVCHDKPGSKLLTDKGKYYEVMDTFAGYDDVLAIFGECTHCHVRKPGSQKLTSAGRKFSQAIEDLEAFRQFLETNHPTTLAEDLGVEDP